VTDKNGKKKNITKFVSFFLMESIACCRWNSTSIFVIDLTSDGAGFAAEKRRTTVASTD
jgi:hypothetical protein